MHLRTLPIQAEFAELLAERYGTPLYVYDGATLNRAIDRLEAAVAYPDRRFHFASVTNGNVELLRIFKRRGWGLHANTPGDVHLGLAAGFCGSEIVYSGSNLSPADFQQMLDWEISTLNLDSVSQLESLISACRRSGSAWFPKIGFRLNIEEITGRNRIGIDGLELLEAEKLAASSGLRVSGIHFYRGTGTNDTSAFTESIDRVIEIGTKLTNWEFLDFGGGFGHPYRDGEDGFSWEWFGTALSSALTKSAPGVRLLIEPGRAVIAGCGFQLCRVLSTKWQKQRQIVGVDTSVANIAVLAVHGGFREIRAVSVPGPDRYSTDVCGNTTFSRDYLGRDCELPRLNPGDLVAILDCGAYGYAMSSHFLHRPRPAEVLIENDLARLVRHREEYEVLLSNQVFDNLSSSGGSQ